MAKHKKIYSFNEREDAEGILKNGFPSGIINSYSMYILAKYYREVLGFGKTRLERALISFCTSQNPNFNAVTESDNIKRWVKAGMNNNLRNVGQIVITHAEMDVIKSIKDLKYRKTLFITLVLAKAVKKGTINRKRSASTSNKYYLNYSSFSKIADMLDFVINDVGVANILSYFIENGLIVPYSVEKECVLLNFTNDDSPMVIAIDSPDAALEYYKIYFGGESAYCSSCGKEIVKSNNKQSRCKECSLEIRKVKEKERLQKLYKNSRK